MPKYFFHMIEHEDRRLDPEGLELPDDESAVQEANKAARDMIVEAIMMGEVVGGQIIEIVDHTGRAITKLPLRSILKID